MQPDPSNEPDDQRRSVARPRPYRTRRAMWGIGALAMSPDAVPEGPRRRRLVRAATVTSVMGLAWAPSTSGSPPPSYGPVFDHVGQPAAGADEESMQRSSPLPGAWQDDVEPADAGEAEPAARGQKATARPPRAQQKARRRERASEATETREARSAEEQKADHANGGRKATRAAAERTARKAGARKDEPAGAAGQAAGGGRAKARAATKSDAGGGRAAKAKAAARRDAPSEGSKEAAAAPDPRAWRTHEIANHEQVTFVQPSATTVLVGFHEAAMAGARPLAVASRPDADHGRHEVPFAEVDDPLPTTILPTRARSTNAASAMDVVIPAREAVFSPVTGTVSEVQHYQLYGKYPDNRMVIVPDERPDLRVVILHIEGVKIAPGDRVTAGTTKIAVGPNPFPFESQIDRFAAPLMEEPGPTPHVHIELR